MRYCVNEGVDLLVDFSEWGPVGIFSCGLITEPPT